jgi:hypothetical protein
VAIDGLPAVDGTVEFVREPNFLGVRTDAGLYMLIHGYQNAVVVEYHDYAGAGDGEKIESAWQSWLGSAFA